MERYIYKKKSIINLKNILRFFGLGMILLGITIVAFVFLPLVIETVVSSKYSNVISSIPKNMVIRSSLDSIWSRGIDKIKGFDPADARKWFPNVPEGKPTSPIKSYTLSVPRLGIKNARVSTVDNDVDRHLVNYGGTAIPPSNGTAAIFGHSTLPWLFNVNDYKKIFATLHTMKIGDLITININEVIYTYKVFETVVVSSESTAILEQNFDDSYITLVTCFPPGTTWKRLLVKAKLQSI